MLFSELNLDKRVLDALEKNGYTEATKIQQEVIRIAMEGKNIIGQSQTGTGKTAAFVIPLLQKIDANLRKPQVIVLAPTRELAMQIREEFFKLSTGMFIRSLAVFGGSNIRTQREALENGPQVIVATPGRLIDLIERRFIDLSHVEYFVLDEVDRMLDMGFIDDIDTIWSRLGTVKQSMTFSATIPQEVKNLLAKYAGEGYESIKANEELMVSKIDHSFIEVPHFEKYEMLKKYLGQHKDKKVVVFARMKHETEDIADLLDRDGYRTGCLHGDMQQRDRTRSLKRFQDGVCDIFVTTDVAARGLNMKDIELVVNYHVPEDPEAYIHRIGRTGRAGAEGRAIMFVTKQEQRLVQNIERRNKIKIKQIDINGNEVVRLAASGAGFGGHHRAGSRRSFGWGGGSYGGRSSGGGSYGGRSSSGGGYRGDRSSSGGGYQGSRSSGERSDRPSYGSDRPSYSSDRPQTDRPSYGSDRPQRSSGGYQGSRPQSGGYSSDRPRLDRPSYGSARPERAGGYEGSRARVEWRAEESGHSRQRPDRDDKYRAAGFEFEAPRADKVARKPYGDRPERTGPSDRPTGGYEKKPYAPPRSRDNAGGRNDRKRWPDRGGRKD